MLAVILTKSSSMTMGVGRVTLFGPFLQRGPIVRFRLLDELPVGTQAATIRTKCVMGVLIFALALRLKRTSHVRRHRASLRHQVTHAAMA